MGKTELYPIKFVPILKERLWGGSKLGKLFGKKVNQDHIGESWEISGVAGDVSVVAEGALKGKDLRTLIDEYGEALLGTEVYKNFGNEFPVLIKIIDARKDLSIQLHPNDELARVRHGSHGKTEMWYIMDAEDDSKLIIGFNKDVSPEEYQRSLENSTLAELLHYEAVSEGDTFFINAGKVHAIGAGIVLAEIQQTSDITYRIFDYNRRDQNGDLRELHTELALQAIDYEKKDDFRVAYDNKVNELNEMVDCPYFTTRHLKLDEGKRLSLTDRSSFTIYLCVKGELTLASDTGKVDLSAGETVLVPACVNEIEINTSHCTLLEVTV